MPDMRIGLLGLGKRKPSQDQVLSLDGCWDRFPTHVLLGIRDLEIMATGNLEDKSAKHAILRCSRARLIWRMAGG